MAGLPETKARRKTFPLLRRPRGTEYKNVTANKQESVNKLLALFSISISCEGCPCGNKCIYQAQGKAATRV